VARASGEAIGSLSGDPALLLAFASGDLDLARSAAALERAAAGGVPAAGMTGKGLIGPAGRLDEGCVAIAFSNRIRAAVGATREASRDLRAAGRDSTGRALEELEDEADLILLFIDSGHGDIAESIAGAYEAAGPGIPLAGGAAGGANRAHLHQGEASEDSTIAVAIASDGPIGIGNAQSAHPAGGPSLVTRSLGQHVEEIDGRPADQVYLEQLGLGGLALDDEQFEQLAITHPLAQPELHGDVRLRHVLGRTEGGAIITGTHIPAGAAIEFTELELEDLLAGGERSVEGALATLGGGDPGATLVFDCAGRRRALLDGLDREVEAIAGALGDPTPPLAGLYTHGEVARLKGAKGDRNHAVVTVVFG